MNPGDGIVVHIFDAKLRGGGHALEVNVRDTTTGQTGFMQASGVNGFTSTRIKDCTGVPFNYRPSYDTAKQGNVVPWSILNVNIATQFEIGHFTPCSSVRRPTPLILGSFVDTFWQKCLGPYERAAQPDFTPNPETSDAPCWPKGYTHHGQAPPNLVTGCIDFASGGDVDFDGTSYWPDWPNSLTPNRYPSPFLQQQPLTQGHPYPRIQFQTTATASDVHCQPSGKGCGIPIPTSPGHFYPFWTQARVGDSCVWEFGQMRNGNTFGGPAQYGGPGSHAGPFGFTGPVMPNPTCKP
jgi:hypothetical protein